MVTLDVEMPNMNGIEFLEKIMRLRPTPVIMISTLTQAGADTTIEALALGAVDCVGKPGPGVTANEAFANLPDKVKAAARSRLRPLGDAPRAGAAAAQPAFRWNGSIAAIGSSTGGVEALLQVISGFPANCPPTVITQHMPATFTKSFAKRLDNASAAHVTEAEDGDLLEPGRVFLAPGGVEWRAGNERVRSGALFSGTIQPPCAVGDMGSPTAERDRILCGIWIG